MPKVFVVDDDESFRLGLGRLLRSAGLHSELFSSADDFLQRASFSDVGCLLLDVRMKGLTGMDLQMRLEAAGAEFPIVFLTGHGDLPMGVQAMKRGAVDFLTKPVDDEILLEAVRRALALHERKHTARLEEDAIRVRIDSLTPREFVVLRCLLSGALNKQVAAHLGIAEITVKVHRARVLGKMGVASMAELTRMCDVVGVQPTAVN